MHTPPKHDITRNNRPTLGDPKNRLIHTIALHRTQQHNGRPVQQEEARQVRVRLAGRSGNGVGAEHRGPVFGFLIVFGVDAGADVGSGVEFGVWEGGQNGIRGEEVVWVVVGEEDGSGGVGS